MSIPENCYITGATCLAKQLRNFVDRHLGEWSLFAGHTERDEPCLFHEWRSMLSMCGIRARKPKGVLRTRGTNNLDTVTTSQDLMMRYNSLHGKGGIFIDLRGVLCCCWLHWLNLPLMTLSQCSQICHGRIALWQLSSVIARVFLFIYFKSLSVYI